MTAPRTLRYVLPVAAACALASAGVADAASGAALRPPSASSSRFGVGPAQATDGVRATSWSAGRPGSWWLRAALRRAAPVRSIDILVTGRGGKLTIATSADGWAFRPAATVIARAGVLRSVDLDGRRVAAVRISAAGAKAAAVRVAELRVHLTAAAAAREPAGPARRGDVTPPPSGD
ncbi:MAG: hypothetical protein JWO74_4599, partial [Solirubrobacterales bacterium]|nr:hypothetical protein [Solirubrobacterales bacterium]